MAEKNLGGAPLGSQNAKRQRFEWRDALRYALANHESDKIERGHALKAIAAKLVALAVEGDKDAWQEIGNRLDGKPSQEITGDPDLPLIHRIERVLIDGTPARDA